MATMYQTLSILNNYSMAVQAIRLVLGVVLIALLLSLNDAGGCIGMAGGAIVLLFFFYFPAVNLRRQLRHLKTLQAVRRLPVEDRLDKLYELTNDLGRSSFVLKLLFKSMEKRLSRVAPDRS